MASGDVVAIVMERLFPGSNPATPDVRPGGSTPAESFSVMDYDGTTDEYVDYLCHLLSTVNLTITHEFMMSSATSGNIEIETGIRRLDTAEDVDTSHTYSWQSSGAVSVPGTSGYPKQTTTAHTTSQVDGTVAGEKFILRVRRDNTVASNATGDMEYLGFPIIRET